MGQKLEDLNDKLKIPGPGTYNSTSIDKTRLKNPAFTMRPKTEEPKDRTPRPAPNTYSPEKVCRLDPISLNYVDYSLHMLNNSFL